MAGARVFIAIVFVIFGAAFVASTGLLIYEFREIGWLTSGEFGEAGWLTMIATHAHLFFFFPILGLLALIAFSVPAVVLTHLYWNHITYGRVRFIIGFVVVAGLACGFAWFINNKELRSIYEVSPRALLADKGEPAKGRLPILQVLTDLRKTAPQRFGLSAFGRSCASVNDQLLELPDDMSKVRRCFPAGRNLAGPQCCAVQEAFAEAVGRLQQNPETRSLTSTWDGRVFLPLKTFFILVVVTIAVLLAIWRDRIDKLYSDLVPALERGVIIGGFAMLFWLAMDYGYQQTANVLYGRPIAGPQLRLSLILVPWALLLLFYFLRRLGRQGELVGQISGVVFAGVAVLRYEQLNDWVVRLFGIGADEWVLGALIGIAVIGLGALLWFRRAGRSAPRSTAASA